MTTIFSHSMISIGLFLAVIGITICIVGLCIGSPIQPVSGIITAERICDDMRIVEYHHYHHFSDEPIHHYDKCNEVLPCPKPRPVPRIECQQPKQTSVMPRVEIRSR